MKTAITTLGAILALLILSASVSAQTGLTFTTSTEATALHYNGAWGAANHTTESLDLLDWGPTKTNSLALQGHEILSPAFNAYLGGVQVTPDLSALFNKTNLPVSSFSVFVQGAFGVSPSVPKSDFTWLAGGGASYQLTPSLSWSTIDCQYGRVGTNPFIQCSTGISYLFNPQMSKNMNIQGMYRRKLAASYNRFIAHQK